MKISVITVCRNAEEEIEKTILSVINQTYQNFEYIIIDGVSTDNTLSILSQYKKFINVLISEPDHGIYDAMNKGITYATGDIICFMNAGDYYYSCDIFQEVINSFNKSFPKPDIIYGDTLVRSEDNNENVVSAHRRTLTDFIWRGPICHQSTFVNRNLFGRGFSRLYHICADYEWLLYSLIYRNARISYIPRPLSIYQMGGFSAQNLSLYDQEQSRIILKYLLISIFRVSPKEIISLYDQVGSKNFFIRIAYLIRLGYLNVK
ncbi:glycosyltransferase family 2 protein [Methanospirillum lacunae]|uniref:Glycosyltransferase n=1 Tax=Methanospirillum lacunae TaxID=668570 RepID=A0A2V2MTF3_9EURY|nr:glycosyltransferase family 2 protein [Methanospirillum lacunae]PWR70689.1 glycosyltransferase [Methanospirillum lacunae]